MILFVFEGNKREPDLFRSIQRLYFPNKEEQIVCSYNNNIYQLYKDLEEYDGDGDIVSLLMEKFKKRDDNPLRNINAAADISEVYLLNVSKANFLCKGENVMPASKDDILQYKIFEAQVVKYVNTDECKVSVLNAFPIFLYDYFK